MIKNRYLNVNIELAETVLRNGTVREFSLYLHLKSICDGYITINKETRQYIKEKMGWDSDRSVRRNLKKLEALQWITKSSKASERTSYYVRGWCYLIAQYDIKEKSTSQVDMNKTKDESDVTGFLFGSFCAKRANSRKWVVRKNRRAKQAYFHDFGLTKGERFCPMSMSVSFFAETFNVSKSVIHRWKKLASRQCRITFINRRYYTNFKSRDIKSIKRAFPEHAYRMRKDGRKKKVYIQLTDRVKHTMKLKSRNHVKA